VIQIRPTCKSLGGELIVNLISLHPASDQSDQMNEREQSHTFIVDSLKDSVREFLEWFPIHRPDEHLYGILIDVPSEGDGAHIIAATDEALERAVRESTNDGESADDVRNGLRWASPGESGDPWFWSEHPSANTPTQVIQLAIDRGIVPRYETTVKDLAIRALAELNRESVFGTEVERERLYVGVMDIHDDFENWVEWSSECNPETVTRRVLAELPQEG